MLDILKEQVVAVAKEAELSLIHIYIVQNDMVMGKSGYIVNWKKAYKQGREALDLSLIHI